MGDDDRKTHHVPHGTIVQTCYVTRDIDAALDRWVNVIGAGPFFKLDSLVFTDKLYRDGPSEDTFIGAAGFLGTTMIELSQPTDDKPSVFQEMLERRGEGLHHIYPNMRPVSEKQYDLICDRYLAAGYIRAHEMVVMGVYRNAFFDAFADVGCFLEIFRLDQPMYETIEGLHWRHVANGEKSKPTTYRDLPSIGNLA